MPAAKIDIKMKIYCWVDKPFRLNIKICFTPSETFP